ncbi:MULTISPECIES: hypothetical protein [Clostridium]|jgi:hypothetical protein|uniref:Uncharacterized protein n=3 Tax=Clostridium butyricum TaxID=1492 RepID=C4IFM5_CLOBU|nr:MULTISPECIES: hypothetical protein [Clostridium]ALS17245.1 hypothetical protein ATD26_10325 [Clostridium butyricum]APF24452.1 hypothetical protein NPD4_2311 [Clostridium butyricum]AXB85170.1 hypothetical protein DRB99_09375 [Clostridium butyricum]EDT76923.1 hypothetical protein CBY_0232 [Clostridium butyricum 5521]EEP54616.1 conserved hypothetical protein [Clostridium butyricum E4 str. BoNT E BL5262]
MEWYCAVFNSDKVNSAIGAQVLYERLCEGDESLVGDIEIIDEFYNELMKKTKAVKCNKCRGYIIISTEFENAEFINEVVMKLAKKHGLSFYEPQNMVYVF